MEAAAVACRGGLLARARPGSRARVRPWEHGVGVGSTPSAARGRLLVASVGVGEPLPADSLAERAVALEVDEAEDVASAETLPPPDVPAKTVRVKFVLQKQCAFGQQFLVVGDDPSLGLWDPTKATALDWSEGHVWTVKTDLPANKLFEFKFLLRNASGHVRWQHGANRTLQTIETPNTLVVHEDWDHAKNQKVSEQAELSSGPEDVIFSDDLAGSNGAVLADTVQTDETLKTNESAVVADASLHRMMMGANEANQQQVIVDLGKRPEDSGRAPRGSKHGTTKWQPVCW
ncbi:uncharacterized protein LOC133909197 isoform X2 [Phragmites australis]|uniref:uncharacterized protein LOC133909197 isoform X2 n=1 Tax=Phragmites australis TaxID=29695 RepID=UPI002D79D940|nr:uncharacterized protein LOC133909197 isoform X2 [Phragmites australis]